MDANEIVTRRALRMLWPTATGALTSTQIAAKIRRSGLDVSATAISAICQRLQAAGLVQGAADAQGIFTVTGVDASLLDPQP